MFFVETRSRRRRRRRCRRRVGQQFVDSSSLIQGDSLGNQIHDKGGCRQNCINNFDLAGLDFLNESQWVFGEKD